MKQGGAMVLELEGMPRMDNDHEQLYVGLGLAYEGLDLYLLWELMHLPLLMDMLLGILTRATKEGMEMKLLGMVIYISLSGARTSRTGSLKP